MRAIDMRPEKNVVGMFVGKAGSGKSTAIASFAEQGPLFFMDFDKRINGIYHSFEYLPAGCRENIEYKQYNIKDGFKVPAEQLAIWVDESHKGKLKWKTIVLESAGTMANSFIDEFNRVSGGKGVRTLGSVDMTGPAHFNYASRAMHKIIYEGLRELKGCNVIVSCWVLDRWGKPANAEDYAPAEVIGTKLNLTDKLSEEVPGYFDEIYEFEKQVVGGRMKHTAKFRSSIAKTSFPSLPNGEVDVTNKSFYQIWKGFVDKEKEK